MTTKARTGVQTLIREWKETPMRLGPPINRLIVGGVNVATVTRTIGMHGEWSYRVLLPGVARPYDAGTAATREEAVAHCEWVVLAWFDKALGKTTKWKR